MKRLMLTLASLLVLSAPALAADLDGPVYRDETYIERPAPPVVERERIIERHYYHEPHVDTYVVPRVYERPVYADRDVYYDEEYRYHRPAYFVGRPFWWHRHHHGWRW